MGGCLHLWVRVVSWALVIHVWGSSSSTLLFVVTVAVLGTGLLFVGTALLFVGGGACSQVVYVIRGQYFTVPHLFLQESGHSSGIPVESIGIPLEFHWNKNGIKQTKVEILIY